MTIKVKGTEGIEFPDSTVQTSAAQTSATQKPPAFKASRSSDLLLTSGSWTTVVFPIEELDTDNWYDPVTGKFTPQIAGWYQASNQVGINGSAVTSIGVAIWKNGSISEVTNYSSGSGVSGGQVKNISGLVYLNGSTDFIVGKISVSGTSPKVDGTLKSAFSAFLVRAD